MVSATTLEVKNTIVIGAGDIMVSKIVAFKNAIICCARDGRIVIYQVGEEGERLWCDFNNTNIEGNILDIHVCKSSE